MIETDRLILRELCDRDFDALYKVLGDTDIMRYYPYVFDEARVRSWISRNINRYRDFGFGLWAVCLKNSGELIGDCGLTMQNINGQTKPEIGYHIRGDMQQKGYGKEAACAVRDWTFDNTGFDEVYSYMPSANIPSQKTAMSYGCSHAETYTDEQGECVTVYRLSKTVWQTMK